MSGSAGSHLRSKQYQPVARGRSPFLGRLHYRSHACLLAHIRITTADVSWAGTDDDVTVTLAGRSWNLDNEGTTTSSAAIPIHSCWIRGRRFTPSDIHSVRIHKSPDGIAGGWKLKGVEVIVNGGTIYNNQSINKWLEDDDRTWSASI